MQLVMPEIESLEPRYFSITENLANAYQATKNLH